MLTLDEFWQERGYAQRYIEAQEMEGAKRAAAFIDVTRTVAGEELRMMTPDDLHVLEFAGNGFVVGGTATVGDLEMMLWTLNAKNKRGPLQGFRYWLFARRFRKMDMRAASVELLDYIAGIFADSAMPQRQNVSECERIPRINTCFISTIIVRISKGMGGLSPVEIRKTPLPQLFSYLKDIRAKDDPEFRCPSTAEKVKSDCMEAYNAYVAETNSQAA